MDTQGDYDVNREREFAVVKDNKLIQSVTRRKYELTVSEQKVLAYILSRIKPSVGSDPQYVIRFEIKQFCKVCGIDYENGKNYRNIKNALDRLAENSFWLDYGEGEFRFQWIVTPDIQRGSGLVEVEIPRKTMPYLWNLSEKFTSYQLYNILALKSSYSIALYELFKSYAHKKTITVTIDELRRYLGIDPEKYKEFKTFRRSVLDRCIHEIETYTDIRVTVTPIRKGRFYQFLQFDIKVLTGIQGWESYNRTMAEINGVSYMPGQIHLFDEVLPEEKNDRPWNEHELS